MRAHSGLFIRPIRVCASIGLPLSLLAALSAAQSPTYSTFTGFTTSTSVDGQGGWIATNPAWDEEVVDKGGGELVWRVSNAVTSGSFGDQPFAPASDLYAGEAGSTHSLDAAGPVTNRFYASFDISSVTGAPQPGLDVTVSPDDGSGKRQSFLSIEDNGAGIDLEFYDTQGNHPVSNQNGGFVSTDVITGLSYAGVHNIAFDITFVDGNIVDGGGFVYGNDIVKIFVDGVLVHTGTTWESYWWTTTEGQVPPSIQAIDTLLFRLSTPGPGSLSGNGYYIDNVLVSTKCPTDFQGFETDISGWDIFSSPIYFPTRVPSGTDGIPSASGGWHAVASATAGEIPAGNWGGYGGNCGCPSSRCAFAAFPPHGYTTSVDVYLDMSGGFPTDTRFDYSSAINQPDGTHRRDFIFNAGFYTAGDATLPGTGSDRFIVSASNNSGQPPWNPGALPIAITTTGWYTFEQRFYSTAGNVLAVDMIIKDSLGTLVNQWTRSNPTDIIGSTVAGNRYGWFPTNGFDDLAFDNARRFEGGDAELALDVADCQDDAFPGTSGYQIVVELQMLNLTSLVTGFQAFVDYDMGSLSYEGALSSYTGAPFSQHFSSANQADSGSLALDGNVGFSPGTPTDADAVLASLVFTVLTPDCSPSNLILFQTGGSFPTEVSYAGLPLATALTDPAPFTLDDTPPTIGTNANISQPADAQVGGGCDSAVVTFSAPLASDDCTISPSVVCVPPSGSSFPVGITTVTCTATDACLNTAFSTFDVEVTPTNLFTVDVVLTGVTGPVTRCIYFATDGCAPDNIELSFSGFPATFSGDVELPCGALSSLCAKDEQHTKWDTSALALAGTKYATVTPLVLVGGDSDNDGDVDINDVTLFITQYGGLAASGGCPWDGLTRDTDFNDNGLVGSEDYTFLTAAWLTSSSCACPFTGPGGPHTISALPAQRIVTTTLDLEADLDKNGFVDYRDVRRFEQRHGLPDTLSTAMKTRR